MLGMGWERTRDGEDHLAWDRDDGYARVTVRRTASGSWAVTVDRLEQAPGGPAYRRETLDDGEAARARAAEWRAEFDTG